MAYTTNAAVLSEFKNLAWDSSGTGVSSTEADEFISQADAFIDGKIGLRYDTPVTGTESLKVLKTISTWLVADRVSEILKLKTGKQELAQQYFPYKKEETLYDKAMAMLKAIVEGKMILSDASVVRTGGGVTSWTYEDSVEHQFQLNENQW